MNVKRFFLKIINVVVSDFYRFWIYLKEIFNRDDKIDVVYITNFQNDVERGFMGLYSLLRNDFFSRSLKLKMKNGKKGQIITINSLSSDLVKDFETRKFNTKSQLAKVQVREAIDFAIKKGVSVVLFGASTKRLFTDDELIELNEQYTQVIFTIGDNGTALKLWKDVDLVLKNNDFNKNDRIAILGPNGFLGSFVKKRLLEKGYSNLYLVSQSDESPFDNLKDIKLVVACSHHPKVNLDDLIVEKIMDKKGIFVVDVCRPYNFTKKEFEKCVKRGLLVKRIDAGNSYNKNLNYDGSIIASIALKQIGLSRKRLFGCFSEASALTDFHYEELVKYNFLKVNDEAINFIDQAFDKTGFEVCYPRNFGKKLLDIEIKNKK